MWRTRLGVVISAVHVSMTGRHFRIGTVVVVVHSARAIDCVRISVSGVWGGVHLVLGVAAAASGLCLVRWFARFACTSHSNGGFLSGRLA